MSTNPKYRSFTDAERKKLIKGMHSYLKKYHSGVVNKENLQYALQWVSLEKLGRPQYNLTNWLLVAFGVDKKLTIKRPVPVVPGVNDGADKWGIPITFTNRKTSSKAQKVEVAIQKILTKADVKKAERAESIAKQVAKMMGQNDAALAKIAERQKEITTLLKTIAA